MEAIINKCEQKEMKHNVIDLYTYLITAILTFFAPALHIVILVILMMLIDTYWGIKLAKKEGKQITSNRMADFFAKSIGYFTFIFIGLALYYGLKWELAVWVSAIFPVAMELFSIDEKQRKLGKKGVLSNIEKVYKLAMKVKSKRDEIR